MSDNHQTRTYRLMIEDPKGETTCIADTVIHSDSTFYEANRSMIELFRETANEWEKMTLLIDNEQPDHDTKQQETTS